MRISDGRRAVEQLVVLDGPVRYGYLGVDLFFLLSGFVILGSAQKRTVRSFLASRALRLLPCFWAALALTLVAILAMEGPQAMPGILQIAANATMMPAFLGQVRVDEVYWTLAVEAKFYFIFAVLIGLGLTKHIVHVCAIWLVLIALCELGYSNRFIVSATLHPHGALFVFGMLLYLVLRDGWSIPTIGLLTIAGTLVITGGVSQISAFIPEHKPSDALVVPIVLGVFLLTLVRVVLRPNTLKHAALWSFLGSLTYPLYLTHGRIGQAIFRQSEHRLGAPLAMLLELGVVLLLSWVLMEAVEQRLVRRISKRSFFRSLSGSRLQSASVA